MFKQRLKERGEAHHRTFASKHVLKWLRHHALFEKDQRSGTCGPVILEDSQILLMTNIVLRKEKKFMGTSMECIFLT